MDAGQIEDYILQNESLTANFCGVYAIDELAKDFTPCAIKLKKQIAHNSDCKLPFVIVNTDPSDKPGQHWFVAILLKESVFIFDSFGADGFLSLYFKEGSEHCNKYMSIDTSDHTDAFTFINMTYSAVDDLQLPPKCVAKLSTSIKGLNHFYLALCSVFEVEVLHITTNANVFQKHDTLTCGLFSLSFATALYQPVDKNIRKKKICDKKVIFNVITNTFYPFHVEKNERNVRNFGAIHGLRLTQMST